MTFTRPDLLWLAIALPALLLLFFRGYTLRRARVANALGGANMLRRFGLERLLDVAYGRIFLLALAAAALGFAAAGPRWGVAPLSGPGRAMSIVLALDVSKSMLAPDARPTRLEQERLFARRLLRAFPQDRFGLVAFAGNAYVMSPLTIDQGAIELYLEALDPEVASEGGSSLAAAVDQSVGLALGRDRAGRGRAVVLISDGEALEEEGPILEAAERAARAGVVIHTVGVGTVSGSRIPDHDPETGMLLGYKRDLDGRIVISKLNEDLLRGVAQRTGGQYVRADEAGAASRLAAALNRLQRTPIEGGRGVQGREQYAWFAGAALLLLALDWLFAARAAAPRPAAAAALPEAGA